MHTRFSIALLALVSAILWSGCQTTGSSSRNTIDFTPALTQVYIEARPRVARESTIPVQLPLSGTRIFLDPQPILLEWDFRDVTLLPTRDGPAFNFVLTPDAGRDLGRISTNNVGRRLVIVINQNVLGVAPIGRPMTDGVIRTYLEIPDEFAAELARDLSRTSQEIQRELTRR